MALSLTAPANRDATGQPAISGTATVGEMLTAAKGTIADTNGLTKADKGDSGFVYTYQWVRVDSDGSSNAADISGATSSTYTLAAADEGKRVKVRLSFKDDADNAESRTSDAYPSSGTIAAAQPPPAQPSGVLTLIGDGKVTLVWDNPGDPTITKYQYRARLVRLRPTWSGWLDVHPSGAGATTHTWESLDSEAYDFQVRAVNAGGDGPPAQVTATPSADGPIVFVSTATPSVAEKATAVITVEARNADIKAFYTITGGADQGKFNFNTTSGVLTFKTAPDYENPTDADANNEYVVVVRARVNRSSVGDVSQTITVTVTNVEEPGTVSISPAEPVAGEELTAALEDPDGSVSGETWQWWRADAKDGIFSAITGATSASYTPGAAVAGKWLRATASYTDGHGPDKTASALTASTVAAAATNQAPAFSVDTATRSVDENRTKGTAVGDPIEAATDANAGDTLTYSMTGTDARHFTFNAATRQISTGSALDHETRDGYTVTVNVTDSKTADDKASTTIDDSIVVTISVTDVDEAGTVVLAPARPGLGTAVNASVEDPDGGVTGGDLAVGAGPTRRTESSATSPARPLRPTRRVAADAGKWLRATASYEDAFGPNKTAAGVSAAAALARPARPSGVIALIGDGQVKLVWDNPRDSTITRYERWTQLSTVPGPHRYIEIGNSGANTTTYLIESLNNGTSYTTSLRAVNAAGPGPAFEVARTPAKSAVLTLLSTATPSVAENTTAVTRVMAGNGDGYGGYRITGSGADNARFSIHSTSGVLTFNTAPDYENPTDADGDNEYVLTVRAFRETQLNLTITVTVTDVDEDGAVTFDTETPTVGVALTAALDDPDGSSSVSWAWSRAGAKDGTFAAITSATLAAYTPVAADEGEWLKATATYTDGFDNAAGETAAGVTASAVAVNVAPTFSSASAVNAAENTTAVVTVTATDGDSGDSVTGYAITGGADKARFSLVAGTGVLTFTSAPDFESPADAASTTPANDAENNEYVVVVTATGGADARALTAAQTIIVTVTNVDEDETVTFDTETPTVGVALTATLVDPDGSSSVSWAWARATAKDGTFAAITGATLASYTPVAADEGQWLQATATYTDGFGDAAGETAAGVTANAVVKTAKVALALSRATIQEGGAAETSTSTVTATLDKAAAADVTVAVSVSRVTAEEGDFTLSTNNELSIAAGETTSTGVVTITAGDDLDLDDETVTVSGMVSGAAVTAPAGMTLTITDDDERPAKPAGFSASPGGALVKLTWKDPDNDAAEWQYSSDDGSEGSGDWTAMFTGNISSDAGALSYTVRGLSNDTEYTFKIRAFIIIMAGGQQSVVFGDESDAVTATPTAPAVVDNTDPVSIVSSPASGGVYDTGEKVELAVKFTKNVNVAGTPRLAIKIGSAERHAVYSGGTGTNTLTFSYVVSPGDGDADSDGAVDANASVSVEADKLELNGGKITVAGTTVDAVLRHGALAAQSGQKAHGRLPWAVCGALEETGRECVVHARWPLTPSGLSAGDKFRLLFVTREKILAIAKGHSTYDGHVEKAAANNPYISDTLKATFKALVSTSASSTEPAENMRPRSHTRSTDKGAASPIYWLGGAKVADGYGDFCDASWDSLAARLENGAALSAETDSDPTVWTGTTQRCVARFRLGKVPFLVNVGNATTQGRFFLDHDDNNPVRSRRLYGLSPVLVVAGSSKVTLELPEATIIEGETTIREGGAPHESRVTASLDNVSLTETIVTVSAAPTVGSRTPAEAFTLSTNKELIIAAGATASTGMVTISANNDLDSDDEKVTVSGTVTHGSAQAPESVALIIRDADAPNVCRGTTATPDGPSSRGLVADCNNLLGARDGLVGSTDPSPLNWATSTAISDWTGVTVGGGRVTGLSLPDKTLAGVLPVQLSRLLALTALDLSGNDLSGSIPTELGGLTKLTTLNLRGNKLSGSIPKELGALSALITLDLSGNDLSGRLPTSAETGSIGLHTLGKIETLNLSGNKLTGTIPSQLSKWNQRHPKVRGKLEKLTALDLSGNRLSGTIPIEIASNTKLERLDLSGNVLSGSIPKELGALTKLETLDLSGNTLTGSLPTSAQGEPYGLDTLGEIETLNLSANKLTGSIPAKLGALTTLTTLNLSGNELSGSIPGQLSALKQLTTLNLSDNELNGAIPEALVCDTSEDTGLCGLMPFSTGLNLTNNKLTGGVTLALARAGEDPADQLVLYEEDGKATINVTATLDKAAAWVNGFRRKSGELVHVAPSTVALTVSGSGGNTNLVDFTPVPPFEISITKNARSLDSQYTSTRSFTLEMPADSPSPENEGEETVTVSLTAFGADESNPSIGAMGVADLSLVVSSPPTIILKDEPRPRQVTLTLSPKKISEYEGRALVTATLDTPATDDIEITVSAAPKQGTGTAAGDFTLTGTTLAIAEGKVVSTGVVAVTANSDTDANDEDEYVTVSGLITGGTASAPSSVVLTIVDDDVECTVGSGQGSTLTPEQGASGLKEDCDILLSSKDVLRGTKSFSPADWSVDRKLTSWQGVITDNSRVTRLQLFGLDGSIPAQLGRLAGLTHLQMFTRTPEEEGLEGVLPATLGNLLELQQLSLNDNRLTGPIPSGLDRLTKLTNLDLHGNELTGVASVVLSPTTVAEDAGDTTVTVTATLDAGTAWANKFAQGNGPSGSAISVTVGGSGEEGAVDFTTSASSFAIAIAKGKVSGAGTFTLTPTADFEDETDETVTVSVTGTAARGAADVALVPASATLAVTDDDEPNSPPTFDDGKSALTLQVAEGTSGAFHTASASDPDTQDTVTYTVSGGADRASFLIDSDAGGLKFKTAPDYESPADTGGDNEYVVEVTATGGTDARALTASQTITVTVTDENEPPDKPDAPTVTGQTATSLTIGWTAPSTTGRPAISGYDVQYKTASATEWTNGPQDVTGTTATIGSLTPSTDYQARVRAKNDEGAGEWSDAVSGTTEAVVVVDQPGAVGFVSAMPVSEGEALTQPWVGVGVVAGVTDPDGDPASVTWQWALGTLDTQGTADTTDDTWDYADISSAAAATYVPVADDVGKRLRATATYAEGGERRTAAAETAERVNAHPTLLVVPEAISVLEGTTAASPAEEKGVYQVRLGSGPSCKSANCEITITAISADTGTVVVFTPPITYNVKSRAARPGDIYVYAPDETGAADSADETVVISHELSGGGNKIALATTGSDARIVTVTVTDDEGAAPAKPAGFLARAEGPRATLSWTDPANAAITRWQYRRSTGRVGPELTLYWDEWTDVPDSGAATATYTVTGVSETQSTDFQVRASRGAQRGPATDAVTAVGAAEGAPASSAVFTLVAPTKRSIADEDKVSALSLTGGADQNKFSLDTTTGVITFTASPDYETPGDANGDNIYIVTARATGGTTGAPQTIDHTLYVAVGDVEEAGAVTLSSAAGRCGPALTASLADGDGIVGSVTWQWARANTRTGAYADITGATSAGYTPTLADDGTWLRATASYTDGRGPGKSASATTTEAVVIPACVVGVAIASDPGADATYKVSDVITATVTFNRNVSKTGRPELTIKIGANDRQARFSSGSTHNTTTTLAFVYTVVEGDADDNGIAIEADKLTLPGSPPATITITGQSGRAAVLTHTALGAQSGHKVDGVSPDKPGSVTAVGGNTQVTLRWESLAAVADITGFQYRYRKTVGAPRYGAWTDVSGSTKATVEAVVTGLTNNTAYTFQVRAVDAAENEGAASDAVTATPRAPAGLPTLQSVPADWALKPAGVPAGGSFRLMFVTEGTSTASSSDIADYNLFVQAQANANATLKPFKGEFRALISTGTVNARDNTATTYTNTEKGVPIYWVDNGTVAWTYNAQPVPPGSQTTTRTSTTAPGTRGMGPIRSP